MEMKRLIQDLQKVLMPIERLCCRRDNPLWRPCDLILSSLTNHITNHKLLARDADPDWQQQRKHVVYSCTHWHIYHQSRAVVKVVMWSRGLTWVTVALGVQWTARKIKQYSQAVSTILTEPWLDTPGCVRQFVLYKLKNAAPNWQLQLQLARQVP